MLYVIAIAAGPAQYLVDGVRAAQVEGWEVCLLLSPTAASCSADHSDVATPGTQQSGADGVGARGTLRADHQARPRARTTGRNALHLDGVCRIAGNDLPLLSREEALLALSDPVTQTRIDLCDVCRPGGALHS